MQKKQGIFRKNALKNLIMQNFTFKIEVSVSLRNMSSQRKAKDFYDKKGLDKIYLSL
jgi:hypothetical protein